MKCIPINSVSSNALACVCAFASSSFEFQLLIRYVHAAILSDTFLQLLNIVERSCNICRAIWEHNFMFWPAAKAQNQMQSALLSDVVVS